MSVRLEWETLEETIDGAFTEGVFCPSRCPVAGGWLVAFVNGPVCFVPDVGHAWGREEPTEAQQRNEEQLANLVRDAARWRALVAEWGRHGMHLEWLAKTSDVEGLTDFADRLRADQEQEPSPMNPNATDPAKPCPMCERLGCNVDHRVNWRRM